MSLDGIDTSYWKTGDKPCAADRKASWPKIAYMLSSYKEKKALTIIKQYYLAGKMPNWKKLKGWGDSSGHLDIFVFLWLHPSWDKDVLKSLHKTYLTSDLIIGRDVLEGYRNLLNSQITAAACPYTSVKEINFPYIEGHGELLFDIFYGDLQQVESGIAANAALSSGQPLILPTGGGLFNAITIVHWLKLEAMLPFHNEFLLQYDAVLELWYKGCSSDPDFFKKPRINKLRAPVLEEALYHIYHFDTEKEGDTCRTRFVYKIREMFDEREFIPAFKKMWENVKSGKIVIEKPWQS